MAEFYHSVTLNEEKCVGCTNCIKRCPLCLQMVLYPWNFSDRKKFRNVTDIVMKLTMHIAKNWQKKA